jgi:hypothetical protein
MRQLRGPMIDGEDFSTRRNAILIGVADDSVRVLIAETFSC